MILKTAQTFLLLACLAALPFHAKAKDVSSGLILEIAVYPTSKRPLPALPLCKINTVENCAATLQYAIELIQDDAWLARLDGKINEVHLNIAPGIYRLSRPLALRWGNQNKNVGLSINGARGQTFISGASLLGEWVPANESTLPKRVNASARKSIVVADISQLQLPLNTLPSARGFSLPIKPVTTELFLENSSQPLASWPNSGFGRIVYAEGNTPDQKKTFSIQGRNVSDWQDEPDLQVHAFWQHDWSAQSYLIAAKNLQANSLTVFGSGSPYGIKTGQRARIEGALFELDTPGEWYLDRFNSKIYYWPPSGADLSATEVSVSTGLLDISASSNIKIKDIVFEKTRGDVIAVNNSKNVIFDNIVIRNTGNRGITFTESQYSGIRNSTIEDTGEGGVLLTGGARATLTPAENFVENTTIKRFSRLVYTYRFGVELAGVGQIVRKNIISDAPHTAIFFKGNSHRIIENEIFDVVKESSDSGAVYAGRDFVLHGTVIEGNFFHDITYESTGREVKGVYLDDQASGVTVRRNIFARVQQPVFIGGGRDNRVEENIFFESSPSLHLDARGLAGQRAMTLDPKGTLQQSLDAVPYRSALFTARFPNLNKIREDGIGAPKYNTFRRNVIVNSIGTKITNDASDGILVENNKLTNEAIFRNSSRTYKRTQLSDFILAN